MRPEDQMALLRSNFSRQMGDLLAANVELATNNQILQAELEEARKKIAELQPPPVEQPAEISHVQV